MQSSLTDTSKVSVAEEPQLNIRFSINGTETEEEKQTLNVLSLFSGCGGMDLGFEGDFSVLRSSVNEKKCPDFIDEELGNGFVQLKNTRFKTVFANDILKEARNAWVTYFSK